ncbi:MAG: tetratricopeptide repeat protein, partial [Burkholderiales bacterium]
MPLLFKLVWEEKAGPKVRKLRGLVQIYPDNGLPDAPLTIKLNASMLLRWLGISAITGYLLVAGGLSLWLDQNPYNKIRFIDLLLPWHWSDLRSLRAAGYLEEGRVDLRAGRLPLGIMKLNAGLARFPQNLTARLELARLYAQFRNYRLLRAVLLGGLGEQPPPPSYLAALFDYAALMDDSGLVLAACNHSLRLSRLPATTRTMVLAKKAETLLALQRFADALALLDQPDFQDYFRGAELRVLALCGLNRAPEAVGFARHWRQTHPDAPEYGLQIISTASRKNGQLDAMEQ